MKKILGIVALAMTVSTVALAGPCTDRDLKFARAYLERLEAGRAEHTVSTYEYNTNKLAYLELSLCAGGTSRENFCREAPALIENLLGIHQTADFALGPQTTANMQTLQRVRAQCAND